MVLLCSAARNNFFLDKKLEELYAPYKGIRWNKAVYISSEIVKVIAIFAGQWPHNSYAIVGGISSFPSQVDLYKAMGIMKNLKDHIDFLKEDVSLFKEKALEIGLNEVGFSYDNFISLNGFIANSDFEAIKVEKILKTETEDGEVVRYGGFPAETGPLARALINKDDTILGYYKLYKNSAFTRIMARLGELFTLISKVEKNLIKLLDFLGEESSRPLKIKKDYIFGEGFSLVEAARGILLHRVSIERGLIKEYEIITPTIWNLGPKDDNYLGVAQKALIGLKSKKLAYFVLRSFDTCASCFGH